MDNLYYKKLNQYLPILINFALIALLSFKALFFFDLTDESQKLVKLYYLVKNDSLFIYDYNIHQFYFLLIYPLLKIIYLVNNVFFESNFILINKFIYLTFLISSYFYLLDIILKNNINHKRFYISIILSLTFLFISKNVFLFTYDSLLSLIFLYFFLITQYNKVNKYNSFAVTIISGLSHPIFGVFFFIYFIYEFYKKKEMLNYLILVSIFSIFFLFFIFAAKIVTIEELKLSLIQSSEMSNFKILEKPKQFLLLSLIVLSFIIIKNHSYFRLTYLLKKNYNKLELIISLIITIVIFTKYKIYIEGIIYVLIYFYNFNNNKIFNNNHYQRTMFISIISIILLSFISGNSLTKVGVIALPAITCGLLINLNLLNKKIKILSSLLFVYLFIQTIFFQYREENFFSKKNIIETRFGNYYINSQKANLFKEVQDRLDEYKFKELTVIGSAPWVYLTGNYIPNTKNIFFDIDQKLFFNYLSDININNIFIIEDSFYINNFKKKLVCNSYKFKVDINNINKVIDRKYTEEYFICKK